MADLDWSGAIDTSFDYGIGFYYTFSGDTHGIEAIVSNIVEVNNKLFVGGATQEYNGTYIQRIISLNLDGSVNTGFTHSLNAVMSYMNVDVNEKLFLVGHFTKSIRRLNLDGSVSDTITIPQLSFNNIPLYYVNDEYNNIYIGGRFTSYSGVTVNRIIKLNYNGTIDTTFNSGSGFSLLSAFPYLPNDCMINSMALYENKLYLTGRFTSYNEVSGYGNLISLNLDGSINTDFACAGIGEPTTIEVDYNGKIYIGGAFTSYSGVTANRIIRLNLDGTIDTTFNSGSGFNKSVSNIHIDNNNDIYCVGRFTSYSGVTAQGIIKLHGTEIKQLLPPTGITISNISYTGATINWVNNNTEDVSGNYIQQYSGGTWVNVGTTTSGATNYNITGLTPITEYTFRVAVYNDYMTIPSDSIIFETLDPSPFNLTVDKIRSTFVDISWELPNPYGTEIQVQIRQSGILGTTWTTVDTLSNTATSFRIIGLLQEKTYQCRVVLIGSEYPSNTVEFYIPEIIYLKSFCEGINYTVTHTTCGGIDGTITINDEAFVVIYDFKLEDVDGNTYELTDNSFKGLTSNYYFLSARPKQEFWSVYGKTPCTFDWIKIESTDTTLSLTNKYVENAMCQGFGKGRGRIGYVFADTETAPDYNLKIYTTSKQLVYDETVSGLTLPFIYYGTPLCYNAVLTNGNGCTYFVDSTCLQGLNSMTVEGIDELYLTKYNSDLTINYWGLEDEDYYIGGYDSNFYTSTKIKEILNYDVWYQIPLNAADARYTQQLIRGRNGITYEESIDIVVHHKDVQKWLDMIALLRDRYVIVFKDNNDNWWTFAYESGTEIRQYRLEENAYKFTFFQPAVTKLLTAISEDYVNTYIK